MAIFPDTDPARHARNAVQTALEILQRTTTLNEQLRGTFESIAVHAGINSGLALVGPTKLQGATGTRWTYTASGPVTNVAARIAALGGRGTILISEETARRVARFFSLQELGKRQLKNVAEEVLIYQILGKLDD
jgi:class 3 adenylate cyclase